LNFQAYAQRSLLSAQQYCQSLFELLMPQPVLSEVWSNHDRALLEWQMTW
jgi:hypothetical protein